MKRSLLLLSALLGALAVLAPLGAAGPPPPAALAFTPSGPYDFGTLAVGATASQAFTLTNTGGTASGAIAISLTGSAFTKTADTCTAISLGAGKSCGVTVQYSPSAAGASDAGQLNATNNKKKGPTTASLALAGAGAVGGHIYWSNQVSEVGTIGRASLDGTGANQNFITGAAPGTSQVPTGVAVDSNYVYWTIRGGSGSNGRIARANLDGTGGNLNFITGLEHPLSVEVDSTYIYWADGGSNPHAIGRANLDGTGVTESFIPIDGASVGLAVDANYIYWGNSGFGSIGRANLDGTGANQSFITTSTPSFDYYYPTGLAVDGTYIYWAHAVSGSRSIARANLDGTGMNRTFITISNPALDPYPVRVDENYIYWGSPNVSFSVGNSTISRANLDGTGVNLSFITGASTPVGLAIDGG